MNARDVLQTIAADMAADAKAFEGAAFNGRNVSVQFGNHGAAIARLAGIVADLLPQVPVPVPCPMCRQMVMPLSDGTLPGHQIQSGPKRSPICRFRGTVAPESPRGLSATSLTPGDCDGFAVCRECRGECQGHPVAVPEVA